MESQSNMMDIEKLPLELEIDKKDDLIKIAIDGVSTNWICRDDLFINRICDENINPFYKTLHLTREIEVKNTLDRGIELLNLQKYSKAIECFDEAIFFDEDYSEALINKSHALFNQGHFVKSLRFYKRAIQSGCPKDIEYHKLLLKKSSEERDNFPKIKRNIYAGDESAAKGEFEKALDFYDKALVNPSRFKNKILYKLLNKKALILVRLNRIDDALESFEASNHALDNGLAYFGIGWCRHSLGKECADSLKKAVGIDKKYLLKKALIFNEIELYGDALDAFDLFLYNHFKLDSSFKSAIEGRITALDNLNQDSSFERDVFSQIQNIFTAE